MRRLFAAWALALAASAAACRNPQPIKPPQPDYRGIEGRASGAEATLAAAPEAMPKKAEVLGKDPEGCTWLRSEAAVTVGLHDTRAQVRAAALDEAEKAAIQDFLGVDIRSRSFDYQQESMRGQQNLIESVLQTTRNGLSLKRKVEEEGFRDLPDCVACRYYVKLKSCIVPIPADSDKDFRVELALSQSRFFAGSEATLSVTATKDCQLYLYDVGLGGETSLIVPNEVLAKAELKAGETFVYPDDALKKRGVHLVAQLPDEKSSESAETIRVIAAKVPLPKKVYEPAEGDYKAVLRRVWAAKADWTEDIKTFVILRP